MKKYCMIFDMGHTVDGIEHDDFEQAKVDAIDTLLTWIADETRNWKLDENYIPRPTEEQIDSWDTMINDCCVYVVQWDETSNEWDDVDNAWFPPYEIENEINWLEWADLKNKYNW